MKPENAVVEIHEKKAKEKKRKQRQKQNVKTHESPIARSARLGAHNLFRKCRERGKSGKMQTSQKVWAPKNDSMKIGHTAHTAHVVCVVGLLLIY